MPMPLFNINYMDIKQLCFLMQTKYQDIILNSMNFISYCELVFTIDNIVKNQYSFFDLSKSRCSSRRRIVSRLSYLRLPLARAKVSLAFPVWK
jgi:hypothetical protein